MFRTHYLISIFIFAAAVYCDPLDEQFYVYLLQRVFSIESQKLEPPALVYVATLITHSTYEAIVPYREKSIGIIANIPKRPLNERTERNKNIAIAYAAYRSSEVIFPSTIPEFKSIFASVGLDINDHSLDLSTPIGIGNYVAKLVLETRLNDGMNYMGNFNSYKNYNLNPYDDYTNYEPKNTAYNLEDPVRWQPNIERFSYGTFATQQFIFPQFGRVKPYSLKNADAFVARPPVNTYNSRSYKKQVDEVIENSKNLNDYRKMISELFDNKGASLFAPIYFLASIYNLKQDDIIILDFFTHVALLDAGIVVWKEKRKYDTVRPFSAIRYLYENQNLESWGGVGKGTVANIKGKEWKSYIRTGGHPEYPSGSACFCSAMFTYLENYFNTTNFGYYIVKEKGSSVIEPGITPSSNITLGPFATYSDYINECAISRLWGGVHFKSSLDEGKRLCKPIGKIAYQFSKKYIFGTA